MALALVFASPRAQADDLVGRRLDEARARLQEAERWDAVDLVKEVKGILVTVVPESGPDALRHWRHGHMTLMMAYEIILDPDLAGYSLGVARKMLADAETGLAREAVDATPSVRVDLLQEKARALLEVARYSLKSGNQGCKERFAQSMEVLEEALRIAPTPLDKAWVHDAIARNFHEASHARLAITGLDEITPLTIKDACGNSAQLALHHTRLAIGIAREHGLQPALAEFRCNMMQRLENAHYWRTNRPLASDSDEYLEGMAQLEDSEPFAAENPDNPTARRVLDYLRLLRSVPGLERKERFERFKANVIDPMTYEPPTPWYLR